jgi:hypothetical protein
MMKEPILIPFSKITPTDSWQGWTYRKRTRELVAPPPFDYYRIDLADIERDGLGEWAAHLAGKVDGFHVKGFIRTVVAVLGWPRANRNITT